MAIYNGRPTNNHLIPIQPVEFSFYVQESRAERFTKITLLVLSVLIALTLAIVIGIRILHNL